MLNWTAKELDWYAKAEAASDYFDRLAGLLDSGLPVGATLHDLGCGNGALAVRLARLGRRVVAVEQNAAAAATVQQRAAEQRLPIEVHCADYCTLPGPVHYPVFCLVGALPQDMPLLQRWGSRQAAVITLDDTVLPFRTQPVARKAIDSQQTELFLRQNGYRYTSHSLTAAFGQPFANRTEAADFARYHNPAATAQQLERYLQEQLVTDPPAPHGGCYLPSPKRVTVFQIKLSD